jgi:hypothetical protein
MALFCGVSSNGSAPGLAFRCRRFLTHHLVRKVLQLFGMMLPVDQPAPGKDS